MYSGVLILIFFLFSVSIIWTSRKDFFEEAKMKLYYHLKMAFPAQGVLRKKHQNSNSSTDIFTRQSQSAKAEEKSKRNFKKGLVWSTI